MEAVLKIPTARLAGTYYERLPKSAHRTGDIWRSLPTFDILPMKHVSGVVITPACDLANHKTPTITYLPILSVADYLLSIAAYSCIRPVLIELFGALKLQDLAALLPRELHPSSTDLEYMRSALADSVNPRIVRVLDGLALLDGEQRDGRNKRLKRLAHCLGDRWSKMLERIVSNAYADDIHFLPPDTLHSAISAVPEPSVALFRLPLTLPRTRFDSAMENTSATVADQLKTATLQAPFLTDLLTRFARLYIRLGSPDLSETAIADMVSNISEGCE